MSIKSRHIKKVIGRKGKVLIIKLPPLPELPRDIYQYIASKIEFLETFLDFRLSCKRANEACQPFKHKLFDQLFDQQTCQPKKYQQNLQREKEFHYMQVEDNSLMMKRFDEVLLDDGLHLYAT